MQGAPLKEWATNPSTLIARSPRLNTWGGRILPNACCHMSYPVLRPSSLLAQKVRDSSVGLL